MNEKLSIIDHGCELKLKKADHKGNAKCDGSKKEGGCLSGLNEYSKSYGFLLWRCFKHNYDLCSKCV